MTNNKELIYPDFKHRTAQELFDLVKKEIDNYRDEINTIKQIPVEKSTFKTTVKALESAGKGLDLAVNTFFNLLHCDADDELMQMSEEVTPLLSDLNNEIGMDLHLAHGVEYVYQHEYDQLSAIDQRLTYRVYEGYKDGGTFLEEEKREKLKQLRKELSLTTLKFGQNVLREQNAYQLHITDLSDIKRVPEASLAVASNKAKEEGLEGWLFDFSFPSYTAIMKYADNRSIREQMYKDRQQLCFDAKRETCNIKIVRQIVTLRHKIAEILGYDNYASCTLKTRMASTPEKVYQMLDDLRDSYLPTAQEEIKTITKFAQQLDQNPLTDDMQPWDWSYYAERYKVHHLQYDEEKTRPYFELNSVMEAMLGLASRLYHIEFTENKDLIKYHQDVKIYNVTDDDGLVGILMTDYFPRKGKQSGAWMTNYVEADETTRPVISIVMNFTPPTSDKPSLLTFNETTTLFHEFGHALHGLLTRVPYASLSGTNVVRDFVELPSQIMENWMKSKNFVRTFAHHYITNEPIPTEILDAIERNALFLEGYSCIRQLGFGYLDMAWHTTPIEQIEDNIEIFEEKVGKPIQLLPHIPGGSISCAFSHIFNGGYAAGYYGYKWAEILDADAFEEFLKHGLEDPETAARFKHEILERGDAEDANILYRNFKGREATVDALKRRSGVA